MPLAVPRIFGEIQCDQMRSCNGSLRMCTTAYVLSFSMVLLLKSSIILKEYLLSERLTSTKTSRQLSSVNLLLFNFPKYLFFFWKKRMTFQKSVFCCCGFFLGKGLMSSSHWNRQCVRPFFWRLCQQTLFYFSFLCLSLFFYVLHVFQFKIFNFSFFISLFFLGRKKKTAKKTSNNSN